jgi:hypothetical protein
MTFPSHRLAAEEQKDNVMLVGVKKMAQWLGFF